MGDNQKAGEVDADLLASLQTETIWVDRFVMSMNGDRVRLAFAEMAGTGQPHFRASIAMSHSDAFALAQLISANIKIVSEGPVENA